MSLLLIDDHALLREGLALMLTAAHPQRLCLQAGSLAEGLSLAAQTPAMELILLDLDLPDSQGSGSIPGLMQACPAARVVVVSAQDDIGVIEACLDAGASGFVHKSVAFSELSRALELLSRGGIPLPPRLLRTAAPPPATALDSLSSRQLEVLQQLLRGASNKLIERRLGLSASTVKTHLAEIFRRLGASNRTQAVVAAAAMGLQIRPAADGP